jgi:HIV Tat-specific factor 1
MASYIPSDAADDEVSQFITAGGYDASEAPLSEQANNGVNRKRKGNQDNEVSIFQNPYNDGRANSLSQSVKKPKVQENRAIYVTNLPRDTNEVEIEEVFSKYGIIDQGADGNKRIKMYADNEGKFNGDALIVYFKKDSIGLAIQMMDDYFFRIEEQKEGGKIRVKEADFSYKRNKDSEQIVSKLTRKDKKASERNRADLNR